MTAIHTAGEPGSLVQTVAENVRAEAARRGLNQSSLAAAIGMARASVGSRWRGEIQWQLEDLDKVAHVLNVSVLDLLRARRDSNSQPSDLESVAKVIDLEAWRSVA